MAFEPFPARAFEGFPSRPPPAAEALDGNLHGLCLSYRALGGTLEPPLVGSSSRGILGPAADVPASRPLRGLAPRSRLLRTRVARRRSCSALVVSHHLDGLLRVAVAGLLHPATGQGFTAFRACRRRGRPKAARCRGQFSRCGSDPSKSSPRQQPEAHHCDRCLPVVAVLPGARAGKTGGCADRDPRRRGGRTPWGQPGRGSSLSRRAGRPIPEGNAAPSSEERGAAVPRRTGTGAAPKSRSSGSGRRGRRSEERRGPALSRRGIPAVPGEARPTPRRRVRWTRGGQAGGAPRSPGGRVPGREAGLRRAPIRSRGGGSDAPKNAGVPSPWRGSAPSGSRGPRGVPVAGRCSEEHRRLPGGSGVHARRLGRCARKRFRCGDAPIRLRGPPHHRARGARGASSRGPRVIAQ
jgi:hypothetical protein